MPGLPAAALACCPLVALAGWEAALTATSDYVHRGLSQSGGDPALQGGLAYRWANGAQAGVWASSIDTPLGLGGGSGGSSDMGLELDYHLGFGRALGADWAGQLALTYYTYPDSELPVDYDYAEFGATLSWRGRLALALAWSPEVSGYDGYALREAPATSGELSLQWPLAAPLWAGAGIGYAERPELDGGYRYWSAGITVQLGRWTADLLRIGSDADARRRFGDTAAEDRTVLSLGVRFGGG